MSDKRKTPEDDNSNLDIRIIEAFTRLDDEDKQKVIDRIIEMLSESDEAEKPD